MLLIKISSIPVYTPVRNELAILEEPMWRAQGKGYSLVVKKNPY